MDVKIGAFGGVELLLWSVPSSRTAIRGGVMTSVCGKT